MNYYEELGISQDAAVNEVRQAYKLLARLLHPDGQTDPHLRALAECQMKRLGDIVETLVNPQKRRQYDDSLTMTNPPHLASDKRAVRLRVVPQWEHTAGPGGFAGRHWFGMLMGIALLGVGTWSLVDREPDERALYLQETVRQAETSTRPRPTPPDRKPDQPKARVTEPDPSANSSVPHAEGFTVDKHLSTVPTEPNRPEHGMPLIADSRSKNTLADETPAAHGDVLTSGLERPAIRKEPAFAGTWLYSREYAVESDPAQYPAVYVEFLLVEGNGTLTGDYRARYRIPDRAVSPDVAFEVRGHAAGTSAVLTWASDTGAEGKAELQLRAADTMYVKWWTTQFSKETATLGSGSAVLIRQKVP